MGVILFVSPHGSLAQVQLPKASHKADFHDHPRFWEKASKIKSPHGLRLLPSCIAFSASQTVFFFFLKFILSLYFAADTKMARETRQSLKVAQIVCAKAFDTIQMGQNINHPPLFIFPLIHKEVPYDPEGTQPSPLSSKSNHRQHQ